MSLVVAMVVVVVMVMVTVMVTVMAINTIVMVIERLDYRWSLSGRTTAGHELKVDRCP